MVDFTDKLKLTPAIRSMLDRLRVRIRAYVWLEGLALAVVWLGLTFWLTLAVDYLPVLLTANELPSNVRAVFLVITVLVLAYVLYRWIFRRAFVRLADHSMALLLERRYDKFHDGLVTAVEMAEDPQRAAIYNPQMLERTGRDAVAHSSDVQLWRVFNFWPLAISVSGATVLLGSLLLFAFLNRPTFAHAISRVYFLDDQPWPRKAKIDVLGVELRRRAIEMLGIDSLPQLAKFSSGRAVKVGKGSSVVLKVRADASDERRVVPTTCTIVYHTADGDRGRQYMQRIGSARDGFQLYSFDGKPFKGVLSNLTFDVIGYDDRQRGFQIEAVENPVVVGTELDCIFPEYMLDHESTAWTPRTMPWTTGTRLPRGTRVTIRMRSTKPLRCAYVRAAHEADQLSTIEPTSNRQDEFEFTVASLDEHLALEVALHDTDEVLSETPQRVYITAVTDESPRVNASLQGIGIAVTPQVVVPLKGKVQDDYGVQRAWVEIQPPSIELYEHPIELSRAGQIDAIIDFRELRDISGGFQLAAGPDNKLVLTVKAADHFDLSGEPNIGSGDRYELDIVTPDELLAILERAEAGFRRRVEQIYEEMSEARDYLFRVKAENQEDDQAGLEPEDQLKDSDESAAANRSDDVIKAVKRMHALKSLYAQRAMLQTRKSSQEVLGVALAFRDIRQQLINNRLDAEDRKSRLENEVAIPLERIGRQLFADLELQIETLETKLKVVASNLQDDTVPIDSAGNRALVSDVTEAASTAVQQADDLLAELEKVLAKLVKFETYAELLDIVRDLLEDQEGLIDTTKDHQRKELLQGLID